MKKLTLDLGKLSDANITHLIDMVAEQFGDEFIEATSNEFIMELVVTIQK